MVRKTPSQVESVDEARRMFCRVVGPWVQDLLRLKRSGMDVPSYRALGDERDWVMPPAAAPEPAVRQAA